MSAKSFPDAVDAAVAFLYKKRKPDIKAVLGGRPPPPPRVVLGKSGAPPSPPRVVLGKSGSPDAIPQPKTTSATTAYELPEPTKKVVRRALDEGNPPDFGNTKTDKYSTLEKNVQRAEFADSVVSNVAFGADIVRDQLPKLAQAAGRVSASAAPKVAKAATFIASQLPKLAAVARPISAVGKAASPVQAALWMLDSARATADPEYGAETEKAVTENLDSDSNPFVKQLSVAASTVARPVSTIRGMLDSLSEADTRRINAELRDQTSQRRMKDLQDQRQLKAIGEAFERERSEAEVPEVDIRQGDKQRTERAARKFFK